MNNILNRSADVNESSKKNHIVLPRSFYLVVTGDTISRIGDYIYELAIPLYVLYLTNSSIWMGIASAVQKSAILIAGLVSGAIIDRNNPRKIIILNSIIQTSLVSLIPILHTLGLINIYMILIIGFLLTGFGFLYRTGVNSLIPSIVTKIKLPMASAQMSFSKFFSKTFGPAVGGFIISVLSPLNSLWIDALSFSIIFIMMILINESRDSSINESIDSEKTSFMKDVKDGFKIVISTNYILSLVILNFMLNIGYVGMSSMFIFHLKDTLGFSSKIIGFIYSADGIGTIIAGLGLPILMKKIKNGKLILVTSMLLGISIFLLGYVSNIFIIGILFGIVMYSCQVINRTMYTFWQMNISKDKLGRVYSISSMLESISIPIAAGMSGVIASIWGSFSLMKICGAIVLIVSILCIICTGISNIDNKVTGIN